MFEPEMAGRKMCCPSSGFIMSHLATFEKPYSNAKRNFVR